MVVGKVIGNIVSTRKNEKLTGNKFLVCQLLSSEEKIVAIDSVGAGIGENVLITRGTNSNLVDVYKKDMPVDAAIIGIVDTENNLDILT